MPQLHLGDCLEVLRTMPDCSVDAVVTDPPYGLSFMGKRWDYDVPATEVWAECLRVLKPGGHLLAFAGTRTQHRMAVRIEDAGFEIRDLIAWIYGSGFPKSHNLKDQWQGWGTALKPALEPITVARKPLVGTVAENVLAHGTGALNIDGCRVGTESTRRPINNIRVHGGADGAYVGQVGNRPCDGRMGGSDAGRWPANLIHDGSEEVTEQFPVANDNSAARFFYCAKASKRDRDEGLEGFAETLVAGSNQAKAELKRGNTDFAGDAENVTGWHKVKAVRNHHPTVKPTDLMRYLCRLITPPGGVVLDPFMGSGSTGKAAIFEGFRFIGIERDPEYLAIAEARIRLAENNKPNLQQPELFNDL